MACSKTDEPYIATSAAFKFAVVDCETTTDALLLTGGDNLSYTATIVEGVEWLSFSIDNPDDLIRTGAFTPVVFVYLQRNTTPEDRHAVVTVEFSNGDTYEVTLTQQKYTTSALFDKAWAEQPAFKLNAEYIYKTYFTTLANSQYVRNYSICYDRQKKVALWVAYPLHTVYTTPSVERTNAWAYDPNTQMPVIQNSDQQYILRGYGQGKGYDRGHQCPSADRYSTITTNKMTFYATNMMPQASRFNQGIWGTLENKVRTNIVNDTLYVVTGTYFEGDRFTTDSKGDQVGLPSNCWKVLLRTKSGRTGKSIQECTAEELMGIGFWLANNESNGSDLVSHARTIAQIEQLTGFTFFRNLPPDAATQVKSQNDPAAWGIR